MTNTYPWVFCASLLLVLASIFGIRKKGWLRVVSILVLISVAVASLIFIINKEDHNYTRSILQNLDVGKPITTTRSRKTTGV